MHIKSLVINGFKSYGKKVELNDFDPEFNAITGLNGTGKSNILDSICFVLGISALNTIRASNMQDIIYKNGRSGVHTANVTITFDNRDKSKSAAHYVGNDKIIISREVGLGSKSEYKLNGCVVPAKKILDFFKSLHINVNNPHFIIMQGRITKVLNMKPIEILSMIEEASGTKIYESQKNKFELAACRQESKLKEIKTVADEHMQPIFKSVDKMKQEMEEHMMLTVQLTKLNEELDCWNYVQLNKELNEFTEALQPIKNQKQILIVNNSNMEIKIKNMKEQLKAETIEDSEKKLIQCRTEYENIEEKKYNIELTVQKLKSYIKYQDKKIKSIEKQMNSSKQYVEAKKKELKDFNEINTDLEKEQEKNTKDLNEIDEKIRSLNSGNIFTEYENGSVQENIKTFQSQLLDQQIENQQCEIRINGLKKKLKEHLTGIEEAQIAYDNQMVLLTTKEIEYQKINDEYLKATEELSYHNSLRSSKDNLLRKIQDLNLSIQLFELNNPNLFFRYEDPQPNFNRRKVYGLVCRLFKPFDSKFELALTTLAGSKLYFIVVEDDTVCNDLLKTNKFPNRVNFIPLNVINSNSLPPNVLRIAQQIGGADNVFPAMSLIKYDEKHLKAIQWVFGQAFICTTKEIAEKVCFDSRVNRHCFTLEGDHFNPSGSLTGGTNMLKLVLKMIASQDAITSQLQQMQSELAQINNKLNTIKNLPNKVAQLRDRQFNVHEEFDRIKLNLQLDQPHQQVIEVNNIKEQIVKLENKLAEGISVEKQLNCKILDLELKMKDAKCIVVQQLNKAAQTRKNILEKIKSENAEYNNKKNYHEKLELEIKDLESEKQGKENQLAEAIAEKSTLEEELIVTMAEFDNIESIHKKSYKDYSNQKEELMKIEEIINACKTMCDDLESNQIKLLKLGVKYSKKLEKIDVVQNKIDILNEKMTIEQKQKAPEMNFSNFNHDECKQSIDNLTSKISKISPAIDLRELNKLQKHLQECNKWTANYEMVAMDPQKMFEIIKELDSLRIHYLQQVVDCVSIEFGKIFSSLLPDTQACLKRVNPDDITKGFKICVAFNGLWKDSLEELSGGQRSLVALSLILAMLLFNPAPFYILDEVDAALDVAHTYNIGNMLKKHFKKSQFIVVSLKEGMFNNANVLFRTKLVDEYSTITRTIA